VTAKLALQRAVLDIMHHGGATRWLGARAVGHGAVFAGHRVLPDPPAGTFAPNRGLAVAPTFIESLLWHLRDCGISVVSLSEALDRLRGPTRGSRFVCFTFDDGYLDNYEVALPIFARLGLPFAVFLTTGFVDGIVVPWWHALEHAIAGTDKFEITRDGRRQVWRTRRVGEKDVAYRAVAGWLRGASSQQRQAVIDDLASRYGRPPANPMLSWDQVREMAGSGLVEFGCHTVSHPMLSALPRDGALRELRVSRAAIAAAIGKPVDLLAYPYGDAASAGPREFDLAAAAGFAAACSTRKATLSAQALANCHDLPRLPLNGNFQRLAYVDLFLSGAPFVAGALVRRMAGGRRPSGGGDRHVGAALAKAQRLGS
jgi:peptidoglycan/xylan/chitin deacetylase (PgdA/CDA1 family)